MVQMDLTQLAVDASFVLFEQIYSSSSSSSEVEAAAFPLVSDSTMRFMAGMTS